MLVSACIAVSVPAYCVGALTAILVLPCYSLAYPGDQDFVCAKCFIKSVNAFTLS